jgi:hypothetical protein
MCSARKTRNTRGFDDNLKSAEPDEINPRRQQRTQGGPRDRVYSCQGFSQASGRVEQLLGAAR